MHNTTLQWITLNTASVTWSYLMQQQLLLLQPVQLSIMAM